MLDKLTSRKFWMAVAAFLASIGGSITGIVTDNEILTAVGVVCTMLAAAIYAASEAYIDGKAAASETIAITATSSSKEIVADALAAAKTPAATVPAEPAPVATETPSA